MVNLPTNCLSVFDYFLGLALKGLNRFTVLTNLFMNQFIYKLNKPFIWIKKRASCVLYFFNQSILYSIDTVAPEVNLNWKIGDSNMRICWYFKLKTWWIPAALLRRDSNKGEFCEIFKETFFTKHLWTIASADFSLINFKLSDPHFRSNTPLYFFRGFWKKI